MWPRNSHKPNESGAAALLIAMFTVVLVVLAAFVTDFGMAYANKSALQNGVDAAALAVAESIADGDNPAETCTALKARLESEPDATTTRTTAETYLQENAPMAGVSLASGTSGYRVDCESNLLVVTVAATQNSPAFLGGAAGSAGIALDASAKVAVGPVRSALRARPIAICSTDAQRIIDESDVSHNILFATGDSGGDFVAKPCGSTPGDWGLLELDGDKAGGADDINEWISDGFDQPVMRSESLDECTGTEGCIIGQEGGVGSNLDTSMKDLLSVGAFTAPVFDSVSKAGGERFYKITGFVTLELCGWDFNKKDPSKSSNPKGACWDPYAPEPVPDKVDWMQVKFAEYTPIGDICKAGLDSACDFGARVAKLAG